MKISIITINLNNRAGLEKTFKSISEQTYQDFEYIVIDGCSNDGSRELIGNNTRINFWKSEKDSGVYDAMNKGIKEAKGEYLLFLNSGDFLNEITTIENVIPQLKNEDIIYGNLIFAEKKGAVLYKYPSKLTFNFLFTASLGHPATFIKKELFEKYGYYDQHYKIIADWVFFTKVIAKEHVLTRHIDQTITIFDTDGMSSDPKNQSRILDERKQFLEQEFPLFYNDYIEHVETQYILRRIQSSKGFRILKKIGVKKFQ
ncbi:glycosyltransferase family 2 protein [Sphingobacterium faecale]|uniref:Glycosyltransferase n=1 Tax=Sphingobacterium faecale TaxID=2803775 RepID=A0ABS1QZQ6_9SPHI|nr:glycosyltransferase family 2 protein [Sphingobacterium faecale]MBL1407804.1 glycosyltransferase [Sphingobacterium faecale]